MSLSAVKIVLAVYFCIFSYSVVHSSEDHCKQDSSCRCVYSNGRGIDLNSLNKNDDYTLAASLDNLTYYYHACKNVQKFPSSRNMTSDCFNDNGYSVCLYNKTDDNSTKLGINSDAQFTSTNIHEINYLRFTHRNYTTSILLICVPDIADTHLLANPPSNNEHHLILYTPAACVYEIIVPGLNGFAVFIIILVSFFLAYLVVGVLVNRLALGARGVEMLPNLRFWTSLPSILMVGIEFVKNGCKRKRSDTQSLDPNSYDAI